MNIKTKRKLKIVVYIVVALVTLNFILFGIEKIEYINTTREASIAYSRVHKMLCDAIDGNPPEFREINEAFEAYKNKCYKWQDEFFYRYHEGRLSDDFYAGEPTYYYWGDRLFDAIRGMTALYPKCVEKIYFRKK